MQKDFHHAATYVISRLAGFGHREAETVSYCAQYVDDATNAGIVHFRNGALYHRISSAHKALDYRNFEELANHQVWIPFHFLPGNGGLRAGEDPAGSFIGKIVCQPNSHVAQDMIRACIAERDSLYGLHRLGVTMHVFADTGPIKDLPASDTRSTRSRRWTISTSRTSLCCLGSPICSGTCSTGGLGALSAMPFPSGTAQP